VQDIRFNKIPVLAKEVQAQSDENNNMIKKVSLSISLVFNALKVISYKVVISSPCID